MSDHDTPSALGGIPVDPARRPPGLSPFADPPPGYTQRPCDMCDTLLWVGPRIAAMRDGKVAPLFCPDCMSVLAVLFQAAGAQPEVKTLDEWQGGK